MHANPAYDADGQGVQLYLTADEADQFCKQIGAVDTAWEGPRGSVAAQAAMWVRTALGKHEKPDATAQQRCACIGLSHRRGCPQWVLPY